MASQLQIQTIQEVPAATSLEINVQGNDSDIEAQPSPKRRRANVRRNALEPVDWDSILMRQIDQVPLIPKDRMQDIARSAEAEFRLEGESGWIQFFEEPQNGADFRKWLLQFRCDPKDTAPLKKFVEAQIYSKADLLEASNLCIKKVFQYTYYKTKSEFMAASSNGYWSRYLDKTRHKVKTFTDKTIMHCIRAHRRHEELRNKKNYSTNQNQNLDNVTNNKPSPVKRHGVNLASDLPPPDVPKEIVEGVEKIMRKVGMMKRSPIKPTIPKDLKATNSKSPLRLLDQQLPTVGGVKSGPSSPVRNGNMSNLGGTGPGQGKFNFDDDTAALAPPLPPDAQNKSKIKGDGNTLDDMLKEHGIELAIPQSSAGGNGISLAPGGMVNSQLSNTKKENSRNSNSNANNNNLDNTLKGFEFSGLSNTGGNAANFQIGGATGSNVLPVPARGTSSGRNSQYSGQGGNSPKLTRSQFGIIGGAGAGAANSKPPTTGADQNQINQDFQKTISTKVPPEFRERFVQYLRLKGGYPGMDGNDLMKLMQGFTSEVVQKQQQGVTAIPPPASDFSYTPAGYSDINMNPNPQSVMLSDLGLTVNSSHSASANSHIANNTSMSNPLNLQEFGLTAGGVGVAPSTVSVSAVGGTGMIGGHPISGTNNDNSSLYNNPLGLTSQITYGNLGGPGPVQSSAAAVGPNGSVLGLGISQSGAAGFNYSMAGMANGPGEMGISIAPSVAPSDMMIGVTGVEPSSAENNETNNESAVVSPTEIESDVNNDVVTDVNNESNANGSKKTKASKATTTKMATAKSKSTKTPKAQAGANIKAKAKATPKNNSSKNSKDSKDSAPPKKTTSMDVANMAVGLEDAQILGIDDDDI